MSKNPYPPEDDDGIISLEEILAEFEESEFDTRELYEKLDIEAEVPDNIIDFPTEEEEKSSNPIAKKLEEKIDHLRRKSEDYAEHMYEEAGVEFEEKTLLAEELLPAVDEEDDEEVQPRRRVRRREPIPPDIDPERLSEQLGRGLSFLKIRMLLVFVLGLLQVVLVLAANARLFSDAPESHALSCYLSAGLLAFAMVLSYDRLLYGLSKLLFLRPNMESLLLLACVTTLFDGLTMPFLDSRGGQLPYAAVCTVTLGCYMLGAYRKRQGQRLACRLAAGVKEPYRVTLDEEVWNGRDAFCKYRGGTEGFGSQIQRTDGAERIYSRYVPVLLLLALAFSTVGSIGRGHPEWLLWALSATLTISTPIYGAMAYGSPYLRLTQRLGKSGAALAGWESAEITRSGDGILLTDTDLFPPGMVEANGVKTYGHTTAETAMMLAHALLAASGSGLERTFRDLLRSHGCSPKYARDLRVHDGDGLSGYVKDDQVFVGSGSFMKIMGIPLPAGLDIPNAVYLAVNGQLAAVFAIHYSMHGNIHEAVTGLVQDKLTPIFATRDFNIMPTMLDKRWHLPVHRMQFPAYARRMELSDDNREHTGALTAILAREGLVPYYEAVTGARRLRTVVRLGAGIVLLGAFVGLFFSFYLIFHGAYASLSGLNMLLFMVLWMIPNYFLRMILASE